MMSSDIQSGPGGIRDGLVSDQSKAQKLEQLVARAREMLPRLARRAANCEEIRRIPNETIRDFIDAGFFRVFQPAAFGGYELDYGPTQIALCSEIGQACGSSAWVMSVVACHAWIIGMFALEAQTEVWGETPEALTATALLPEAAHFERVTDGFQLSGRWKFASGIDHADWVIVGAPLPHPSQPPETYFCLVPRRDFEVLDTWFVGGLRGTGSNDVRMSGVFVPHYRAVPLGLLARGAGPGAAVNRCHIYRLPLISVFPYNIASPGLGIARGVVERYCERVRNQPAAIGRTRAAEAETTQLRVSEAAVRVDCATALMARDAQEINRIAREGQTFTPEQGTRVRRDLGYAARLCMEAVDTIHYASGAHGLFEDSPLQRAFRDIHAVNAQAGLRWEINGVAYGKVALGVKHEERMG